MARAPRRLDVMQAAAEALQELEIDQTRPVDPFAAMRRIGLVVDFRKLGDLLGAIVPAGGEGSEAGVLITTERGGSVQRFTAAHEIGHWFLDQDFLDVDLPHDTEEEVLGAPTSERERNAQLFASHFLMPLPLVTRTAKKYGVKRKGTANPIQAYSIARDMHVSLRAATLQLRNCGFIDNANVAALMKVQPKGIKEAIAGRRPTVAEADVWSPRLSEGEQAIEVFQGDDIVVELPENRTTGHFWSIATPVAREAIEAAPLATIGSTLDVALEQSPLEVVADTFRFAAQLEDGAPLVGQGGARRIVFHAESAGEWQQRLSYVSPFRPEAAAADRVTMNVRVLLRPLADFNARLLEEMRGEVELGPADLA